MYPQPVPHGNKIALLLCVIVLLTTRFTQAQCIASGPNSPASAASVPFTGSDYSFSNPTNCLTLDNNRSTASSILSVLSGQTEYLQATNFGFSIPTAATICGIEVNIEKSATNLLLNLTSVEDNSVRMIKSGTLTGNNMAQLNVVWSEDNDATSTYGDNYELWGTTWTPSEINSANFGVAISAEITGIVGLLPAARIDGISITVYYLDPFVLTARSIQFHAAHGTKNTAMLSWKFAGMDEIPLFTVERSANGTVWEALRGTPKKTATSLYTFIDAQPLSGKSLYRLKMRTGSAKVSYSMVQPFESTAVTSLTCYPNPFTSFIQVAGVSPGERVTLSNLFGQRLYESPPAIKNMVSIDINDLQPGMYVISAGNRKIKVQKK
jgi:hypothetical protein